MQPELTRFRRHQQETITAFRILPHRQGASAAGLMYALHVASANPTQGSRLMQVDSYVRKILVGLIVIAAVAIASLSKKRRG